MVRPAKTQKVDELKELLEGAKSIVLNDFTGLNVADISELRRKCRENKIIYTIVKNTLAKRSFHALGLEEVEQLLEGPTAIAVSKEDEVTPAKVLDAFASDYELPRFKGAYVAGRLLDEEATKRLASLPSKEVLLAQVLSALQAPMRGLIYCLGASQRDLVNVLKAISDKKEAAS
jgi:large subunit ribosomal protein L10